MRINVWIGILVGLLAVGAAAQNNEQVLRQQLSKKQLFLRGFGADPHLRGHWDGSTVVMDEPHLHTLGVFTATSVKVKSDKVEIQGYLQTLVRRNETHISMSLAEQRLSVELDLKGADMATVVPQLPDKLFFANLGEARAALPEEYQKILPLRMDVEPQRTFHPPSDDACDCSKPHSNECQGEATKGVTPPSILKSVEPEYSDQARADKFGGNVQLGIDINTEGHPYNLWLVRPAGEGLDVKAAEAVEKYVFHPGTCYGHPVAVSLFMEINFSM